MSDGKYGASTGWGAMVRNWDRSRERAAAGAAAAAPIAFADDQFTLAGATPTLTLTYDPLAVSVSVYLNGLEQQEGVDWSRSERTVTVLAAMHALTGDLLEARYAYTTDDPLGGTEPPSYVTASADAGSTSTATLPITGVLDGDVLLFAATTFVAQTFTTPAGWTLLTDDAPASSTGHMSVWARIADGTETSVTAAMSASNDWAAMLRIYRDGAIPTVFAGNGNNTNTSTWNSPATTAAGPSYLVHIYGGRRSGFVAGSIVTDGALLNSVSHRFAFSSIASADELVDAGATTARTATTSGAHEWTGVTVVIPGADA